MQQILIVPINLILVIILCVSPTTDLCNSCHVLIQATKDVSGEEFIKRLEFLIVHSRLLWQKGLGSVGIIDGLLIIPRATSAGTFQPSYFFLRKYLVDRFLELTEEKRLNGPPNFQLPHLTCTHRQRLTCTGGRIDYTALGESKHKTRRRADRPQCSQRPFRERLLVFLPSLGKLILGLFFDLRPFFYLLFPCLVVGKAHVIIRVILVVNNTL
mmetsp:Transcript_29577/g.69366  ORF Transcript_29577/g.69366 Transcript_29577/m.69366 type:complete len:213 (+) Transcript_29577:1327-1965(+)